MLRPRGAEASPRPARSSVLGLTTAVTLATAPVIASAQTVEQAVGSSCSTTSVKGLSLQIIEQGQCIEPSAFTEVPAQPNVSFGSAVFPYLEAPARDAFVAAVQSKPSTSMTVNSMLRTVAQQYLLYRWYQLGQCGIGLAASPGNSNHETGLALDISQYNTWKSTLQGHGFKWLGSNDPVHFDYVGAGAVDYRGVDVEAFQQLWNLNHPGDVISEDGEWGPQTMARMQQSPAMGFALGPTCDPSVPPGPVDAPDIEPWIELEMVADVYDDGASLGIADAHAGESFRIGLYLKNHGAAPAQAIEIGLRLPDGFVMGEGYVIESDWGHPESFTENDANLAPENPSHDMPLEPSPTFAMYAMSPGETKRVMIDVVAVAPSVSADPPPEIALWVRSIDDHYVQDELGGPIEHPGGTQTFLGGVLEQVSAVDIYDPFGWRWDTDRLEGWSGEATVVAVHGGALEIAASDGGLAKSPVLEVGAEDHPTLYVNAAVIGGAGPATVYFATEGATAFDATRAVPLALPEDGSFGQVAVDLSSHPDYAGTVTQLWIGAPSGTALALDSAGFTLEAAGASGDEGEPADDLEGCGCRAVGSSRGSGALFLSVIGLAAIARGRRRRSGTKHVRDADH